MLVNKNEIEQLIPQRAPILMIDTLLSQDELKTETTFEVLESNIFIRNNHLQEGGIIENIAQSAAARAGYYYKTNNLTPPLGFIGGISKLEIFANPKVGDVLRTVIEKKNEVFNITLIKGTSFVGEQAIATCEMKIVIDDSTTA